MSDPHAMLTVRSTKGIKMFAHHLDPSRSYCVCGSAWNFYEKGCSFLYPIVDVPPRGHVWDEDELDYGYFECGHGHSFCGRH
jgi:hypothetical protein